MTLAPAVPFAHAALVVEYVTPSPTVARATAVTAMTAAPTVFPTTTVDCRTPTSGRDRRAEDVERVQQRTVEQTMEVPQVQYTDRVINVPVAMQRTVSTVRATQKTVEVPQIEHVPVRVTTPSPDTRGSSFSVPRSGERRAC